MHRLLQFSVSQPLNDAQASTLIRSCTLGELSASIASTVTPDEVPNPKKDKNLTITPLDSAAACLSSGIEVSEKVELFTSGHAEDATETKRVLALLDGMQDFFGADDNCDESFAFAYHNEFVVGVYVGSHLGRSSIQSSLKSLTEQYLHNSMPPQVVAELCHSNGTDPEHVLGVVIENTRNLASVQDKALQWSKGRCVSKEGFTAAELPQGAKIHKLALQNNGSLETNTTYVRPLLNGTSPAEFKRSPSVSLAFEFGGERLHKRATCSYLTVVTDDTCPSLVKRCSISSSEFVKYNPKTSLCSTLKAGDYICCSAGDLPQAGLPTPKPGADGVCATYLIGNGDTCDVLSKRYGVTIDDIEKWNKGKTWAWTVCKDMLFGYNMCLSDGFAPMPPSQQGVSDLIGGLQ